MPLRFLSLLVFFLAPISVSAGDALTLLWTLPKSYDELSRNIRDAGGELLRERLHAIDARSCEGPSQISHVEQLEHKPKREMGVFQIQVLASIPSNSKWEFQKKIQKIQRTRLHWIDQWKIRFIPRCMGPWGNLDKEYRLQYNCTLGACQMGQQLYDPRQEITFIETAKTVEMTSFLHQILENPAVVMDGYGIFGDKNWLVELQGITPRGKAISVGFWKWQNQRSKVGRQWHLP